MATASSTHLNDHGLIIVPRCADSDWAAQHGSPTVDIVAIHGLSGKRWSTWTHKEKGKKEVMWLQDLLPEKLPQARIMTFGYNADMINNYSTSNIRDHARKLLSLLRNKRDEGEQSSLPIIFVCHSLGGIVAKQALRIATNETPYNSIAEFTRGIIFMGTPHRGSDLAFWGSILAGIAKAAFLNPSKNIKELKNNSSTLMDVSEDFRSIAGRYYIVSFYEDTKIKGLSKEVVGKHSAVMEITGEEAIPLEGNHMEICAFSGADDERFEEVWKAIKRAIESGQDQVSFARLALKLRLAQLAQFDHLRFLEKMPAPLEGTCKWVLDHPAYRSWLECSGTSILYIIGKTGCGKSMISKHLLADCKSRLDWIASGYFSFSATEGRRNLIQVYSSFLLQILTFATSMYPCLIEACSARPEGDWDEKDVETLLEQALAIFPHRRIILVLDALDECDAFGSVVLGAIKNLCRKAPWCRVLVTSRPNEGVPREDIISVLNLDKEPGLEADIKLFIADRVRLLMTSRPFFGPLKSEISKRLNERAEGMFLLVEHIYRNLVNLKRTSRKDIRETLDSLPETLEDAYAQTFDRVHPEDQEFARSVLICLLYASRSMTVSELAIAVAITSETPSSAELADAVALSILYDINMRIGPIVTVSNYSVSLIHSSIREFLLSTVSHGPADTHQSNLPATGRPRDRYENSGQISRKWYMIGRDEGNNDLLLRCMRYIELFHFEFSRGSAVSFSASQQVGFTERGNPGNEEEGKSAVDECLRFLPYVIENIPDHARKMSKNSTKERKLVKDFFQSYAFEWWQMNYWKLKDPSRAENRIGPLAIACLLGLKLTVEDLVPPGHNIAKSTPYGSQNLLEAAIEGGVFEIVEFLVDRGADIHEIIKEREIRTLLSAAVWYGRTEVIALLMDKSDRLSIRNEEMNGYTAIDVAVEAGRQAIVRWLHDHGAPLNLGSDSWHRRCFSALHVAALSHRSGMIPILLELGADNQERSRYGDLAFHLAAQSGDLTALEMLKPRNIDERGADKDTALLRAAKFLQKEAVIYLLKENANKNARNRLGNRGSAVHLALMGRPKEDQQKAKEVLEALLLNGFDMLSEDSVLSTVLDAVMKSDNELAFSFLRGSPLLSMTQSPAELWKLAIGKGAFDICNILLQTDALDINTADNTGTTALHAAAKHGNVAFCQKLVSTYHAKITIRDNDGRTPLHDTSDAWKSGDGSLEVARVLLDQGSQILDMVDNHGLTALHLAAKGGSLQMIRLLLKRGAAMDAVDDIGRTPLHLCSGWGWEKPKLLLEAGADPSIRAKNGESVAIRMADRGLGMAMEVIFRLGFRFRGSDVLETVKVGEKEEIRVSRLLWYTYVNGDVELAQNLLDSGKITSDDKKEGIKWALKEKAQSVLDLLSPTLDKKYLEATLGTEFATLLIQPVSGTRTEDILFIIRSNYLNLNETYLPAEHQDHRPLRHRVKFNPLIEASERGELEFVTEMLRKQTCTPIGNHVIRMAHRLARQEKHERVVEVLAGYLEVLTSG